MKCYQCKKYFEKTNCAFTKLPTGERIVTDPQGTAWLLDAAVKVGINGCSELTTVTHFLPTAFPDLEFCSLSCARLFNAEHGGDGVKPYSGGFEGHILLDEELKLKGRSLWPYGTSSRNYTTFTVNVPLRYYGLSLEWECKNDDTFTFALLKTEDTYPDDRILEWGNRASDYGTIYTKGTINSGEIFKWAGVLPAGHYSLVYSVTEYGSPYAHVKLVSRHVTPAEANEVKRQQSDSAVTPSATAKPAPSQSQSATSPGTVIREERREAEERRRSEEERKRQEEEAKRERHLAERKARSERRKKFDGKSLGIPLKTAWGNPAYGDDDYRSYLGRIRFPGNDSAFFRIKGDTVDFHIYDVENSENGATGTVRVTLSYDDEIAAECYVEQIEAESTVTIRESVPYTRPANAYEARRIIRFYELNDDGEWKQYNGLCLSSEKGEKEQKEEERKRKEEEKRQKAEEAKRKKIESEKRLVVDACEAIKRRSISMLAMSAPLWFAAIRLALGARATVGSIIFLIVYAIAVFVIANYVRLFIAPVLHIIAVLIMHAKGMWNGQTLITTAIVGIPLIIIALVIGNTLSERSLDIKKFFTKDAKTLAAAMQKPTKKVQKAARTLVVLPFVLCIALALVPASVKNTLGSAVQGTVSTVQSKISERGSGTEANSNTNETAPTQK